MRFLLLLLLLLPITVRAQAPPTPTATPLAHAAAPDVSTRVNVFWPDISSVTGRETTAYTWNVYRCTGAGCTPTVSVATGRTTQDFGDSGLSPNTTYGYAYTRVSGGNESSKSPTVYVLTAASNDHIVRFPNTNIEYVLGPLKETSPFTWYDSTIVTAGSTWASRVPAVGPHALTGTVTVSNGSTSVTGTGTFFLEQLDSTAVAGVSLPYNHLYINSVDAGTYTINSNTSITLDSAWSGSNQVSVAAANWNSDAGQYDQFLNVHYYDLGLGLYAAYYRTGNLARLREAHKVADAILTAKALLGRNRECDNCIPPRHASMGSVIVRALEGRADSWDWLNLYTRSLYNTWIVGYRSGGKPAFLREQAYMFYYANLLQKFLPDTFPISNGSTMTINSGLTRSDGATLRAAFKSDLETDVVLFGNWQTDYGEYLSDVTDCCSGTAEDNFVQLDHNIIVGLLTDAMGYIYENTNLSTTARDSARKQILKSANDFYLINYRTQAIANDPTFNWRAMTYFGRGGTFTNPNVFVYGGGLNAIMNSPFSNSVVIDRQNNPLAINAHGWAYVLSGDPKYKAWGDEFANSSFAEVGENTGGTGDGLKALCALTNQGKNYGECFRSTSRYFSQRDEIPASIGTPPTVTLPADMTLANGVNYVSLTMTATGSNLTYYWTAAKRAFTKDPWGYDAAVLNRTTTTAIFAGLEPGVWTIRAIAVDQATGLAGYDDINVTVGDGIFYPVVYISEGSGGQPSENLPILKSSGTTSVQLAAACAMPSGGAVTSAWSQVSKPANASNSTVGTPTATSSTITGMSDGDWLYLYTCTNGSRVTTAYIAATIQRSGGALPTALQNAPPVLDLGPDQSLPAGATVTTVNAKAIDPEAYNRFPAGTPPIGYRFSYAGFVVVTALTHSWSEVSGPNAATITNGTTLQPTFSNLVPGAYVFRLQSSDPYVTVSATLNVQIATSRLRYQMKGKVNLKGKVSIQ